jgi:hypothetical protein
LSQVFEIEPKELKKRKTHEVALRGPVYIDRDAKSGPQHANLTTDTHTFFHVDAEISLIDFREAVILTAKEQKIEVDSVRGKIFSSGSKVSVKMSEIKGDKDLWRKWPTEGDTLHVGIGARPDDYNADEAGPTSQDSKGNYKDLRGPPDAAAGPRAGSANNTSQTDHAKRQAIRAITEAFYNDPRSTLYHGLTTFHAGIMCTHLFGLSSTNEKLYKRLMTDVKAGMFPSKEDWDLYATGDAGWALPSHVSCAQKCEMEEGKYPPNKKNEMPTADQGQMMDIARRRGGAGAGAGASSASSVTPLQEATQTIKEGNVQMGNYFNYKMQTGQAQTIAGQAQQIAQLQGQANNAPAAVSAPDKAQKYKRKFDTAIEQKVSLRRVGTTDDDPLMKSVNADLVYYKNKYDQANVRDDSDDD